MKKFFSEFKQFITRGNVLDMAVGVIVGGAFTAIVNALSNNILKPLINWVLALIFGANSLSEIYTFLRKVPAADGTIDLAQSIYIDWGAFINAIINFILIALVLFCIVKAINSVHNRAQKLKEKMAKKEEEEKMVAVEPESAPAPEPEPVVDENTELLKEIRDLLKPKSKTKTK